MRTLNVSISDKDFNYYGLNPAIKSFNEIADRIRKITIREALYNCQQTAQEVGLSELSMEEIDKEIKAVRRKNAKGNN